MFLFQKNHQRFFSSCLLVSLPSSSSSLNSSIFPIYVAQGDRWLADHPPVLPSSPLALSPALRTDFNGEVDDALESCCAASPGFVLPSSPISRQTLLSSMSEPTNLLMSKCYKHGFIGKNSSKAPILSMDLLTRFLRQFYYRLVRKLDILSPSRPFGLAKASTCCQKRQAVASVMTNRRQRPWARPSVTRQLS